MAGHIVAGILSEPKAWRSDHGHGKRLRHEGKRPEQNLAFGIRAAQAATRHHDEWRRVMLAKRSGHDVAAKPRLAAPSAVSGLRL